MTESLTDIKKVLRRACHVLLRPIASVFLKSGMTWKEFSDIAKTVFVSVASDEFGIKGRPTNVSRTSILTGISRKEVKRQRDLKESDASLLPVKTTDATRLLSAWHQDPIYLDQHGLPLPLQLVGATPSFRSLFETYGGDTPEQTLVKELTNVGSMVVEVDGKLRATRRYHMPVQTDIGHVQIFCSNLNHHANTLCNNLYGDESGRRLEGVAMNYDVDPDAAADFRDFVDRAGQRFLEEIDAWLGDHRVDSNDASKTPISLGLGVYAIEGANSKGISK